MAASEWKQLARARPSRRLKILARHIIQHPVLIVGLIALFALLTLAKHSFFPMAYVLIAPGGTIMILASMGRFRTRAEDPAEEDASLPADTDGK